MNDTKETMAYLRHQAQSGTTQWGGMCLKLQRTARGIPGVFPSAISAANATPTSHRYSLSQAKRGMVAYFDSASSKFGHITAIAGRNDAGELLHWSSDVPGPGQVGMVTHSFFKAQWGQSFLFAADWLNGQVLELPGSMMQPRDKTPLNRGERVRKAIRLLNESIKYHDEHDHPNLVKALKRDRDRLKATLDKFGD